MIANKPSKLQSKIENINVRVAPKIRFGIELLARKQRRNLSSVVEWALQRAMDNPDEGLCELGQDGNNHSLLDILWNVDEFDRLYYMSTFKEDLLTYEEESLIKLIRESELAKYFQKLISKHTTTEPHMQIQLFCERFRPYYPIFKKINSGELSEENIPKPPTEWKSKQKRVPY